MKNKIGVMQGRLLPKYKGRYQAHPVGYWQNEFKIAQKYGLDCIEFILDFNNLQNNPLMQSSGIDEMMVLSESTGVTVNSICADYFMYSPFHSKDKAVVEKNQKILLSLIKNTKQLGLTDIVIPCVDNSSLFK